MAIIHGKLMPCLCHARIPGGKQSGGFGDDSLVGKVKRSTVKWYGLPVLGVVLGTWATLRFSLLAPDPPVNPDNVCDIFREHTVWYDYARASEQRWGTPIATQMAFVY